MGLIEMEKCPYATIVGIIGLTFAAHVTVPYVSPVLKVEFDKQTYHAQDLHAPGTWLASTASSCSSFYLVPSPDHLEYTLGAVSTRIAADLTFVAKQSFSFPPKA